MELATTALEDNSSFLRDSPSLHTCFSLKRKDSRHSPVRKTKTCGTKGALRGTLPPIERTPHWFEPEDI
ncbi:UNVERIFIED_CONTAM: hypothetical protein NCL1_19196 [Trichonephila clavipes]